MTIDVRSHVVVVGAGGIGCALGYALRSASVSVTFVESNERKVAAGRRDGVRVEGRAPLPAEFVSFQDWSPTDDALILLCTKCYDTGPVLERIGSVDRLLPVQNGFDSRLVDLGHPSEGIASFVSECEPDRPATRITRPGALHLGACGMTAGLAQAFRKAKLFSVVEVPDILPFKYTKLLYNAAISPLAAAAGMDNGKLLSDARARRLFFEFLRENYNILAGAGLPLGKVGPFYPRTVQRILRQRWLARLMARAFEPTLRGTYCSMSGDIGNGRTEIDNYNGWLVKLANERACPLNRRAVEVIRKMTAERIPPSLKCLEWFE